MLSVSINNNNGESLGGRQQQQQQLSSSSSPSPTMAHGKSANGNSVAQQQQQQREPAMSGPSAVAAASPSSTPSSRYLRASVSPPLASSSAVAAFPATTTTAGAAGANANLTPHASHSHSYFAVPTPRGQFGASRTPRASPALISAVVPPPPLSPPAAVAVLLASPPTPPTNTTSPLLAAHAHHPSGNNEGGGGADGNRYQSPALFAAVTVTPPLVPAHPFAIPPPAFADDDGEAAAAVGSSSHLASTRVTAASPISGSPRAVGVGEEVAAMALSLSPAQPPYAYGIPPSGMGAVFACPTPPQHTATAVDNSTAVGSGAPNSCAAQTKDSSSSAAAAATAAAVAAAANALHASHVSIYSHPPLSSPPYKSGGGDLFQQQPPSHSSRRNTNVSTSTGAPTKHPSSTRPTTAAANDEAEAGTAKTNNNPTCNNIAVGQKDTANNNPANNTNASNRRPTTVSLVAVLFAQCGAIALAFVGLIVATTLLTESAARTLVGYSVEAELQYARSRILAPIANYERQLLGLRSSYLYRTAAMAGEFEAISGGGEGERGSAFVDSVFSRGNKSAELVTTTTTIPVTTTAFKNNNGNKTKHDNANNSNTNNGGGGGLSGATVRVRNRAAGDEPCSDKFPVTFADSAGFFIDALSLVENNPMIPFVYHLRRSATRNHSSSSNASGDVGGNGGAAMGPEAIVECDVTPTHINIIRGESDNYYSDDAPSIGDFANLTAALEMLPDETDYHAEPYVWQALSFSEFSWLPYVYYDTQLGTVDLLVAAHAPLIVRRKFSDGSVDEIIPRLAVLGGEDEGASSGDGGDADPTPSTSAPSLVSIVSEEALSTMVLEVSMSAFTTLLRSVTPDDGGAHTSLYNLAPMLQRQKTSAGGSAGTNDSSVGDNSSNSGGDENVDRRPTLICTSAGFSVFNEASQTEWPAGATPSAAVNKAFTVANPLPTAFFATHHGDDGGSDAPIVALNEDFGKSENAVRIVYRDGLVISTIAVETTSGITFAIVQAVPENFYFAPIRTLRAATIAIGVVAAFLVVSVCAAVGIIVRSPIRRMGAAMQLASSFRNEEVPALRSPLAELDALCVSLFRMNQKLLAARAFIPPALLTSSGEEDEDDDEGDHREHSEDDAHEEYEGGAEAEGGDEGGRHHRRRRYGDKAYGGGDSDSYSTSASTHSTYDRSSGVGGGGGNYNHYYIGIGGGATTPGGSALPLHHRRGHYAVTAANRGLSPHNRPLNPAQNSHANKYGKVLGGGGYADDSSGFASSTVPTSSSLRSGSNTNSSGGAKTKESSNERRQRRQRERAAMAAVARGAVGGMAVSSIAAVPELAAIGGGQHASQLLNRRVTVLVINGRGFHALLGPLASMQPPRAAAAIASDLTNLVATIASEERGVIDSFNGDHFVVSFNAAKHNAQGAQKAIACAMGVAAGAAAIGAASAATAASAGGHHNHNSPLGGVEGLEANRFFFSAFSMGISSGRALVGHLGTSTLRRQAIVGRVYARAVALEATCRAVGREEQRRHRMACFHRCASTGEAANVSSSSATLKDPTGAGMSIGLLPGSSNGDASQHSPPSLSTLLPSPPPVIQCLIDGALAAEAKQIYLIQLLGGLASTPFTSVVGTNNHHSHNTASGKVGGHHNHHHHSNVAAEASALLASRGLSSAAASGGPVLGGVEGAGASRLIDRVYAVRDLIGGGGGAANGTATGGVGGAATSSLARRRQSQHHLGGTVTSPPISVTAPGGKAATASNQNNNVFVADEWLYELEARRASNEDPLLVACNAALGKFAAASAAAARRAAQREDARLAAAVGAAVVAAAHHHNHKKNTKHSNSHIIQNNSHANNQQQQQQQLHHSLLLSGGSASGRGGLAGVGVGPNPSSSLVHVQSVLSQAYSVSPPTTTEATAGGKGKASSTAKLRASPSVLLGSPLAEAGADTITFPATVAGGGGAAFPPRRQSLGSAVVGATAIGAEPAEKRYSGGGSIGHTAEGAEEAADAAAARRALLTALADAAARYLGLDACGRPLQPTTNANASAEGSDAEAVRAFHSLSPKKPAARSAAAAGEGEGEGEGGVSTAETTEGLMHRLCGAENECFEAEADAAAAGGSGGGDLFWGKLALARALFVALGGPTGAGRSVQGAGWY